MSVTRHERRIGDIRCTLRRGPRCGQSRQSAGQRTSLNVNTPEKSRAIAQVVDGVVVGSWIVSKIAVGKSTADVLAFVRTLTDRAHSA